MSVLKYKSGAALSPRSATIWKIVQAIVWLIGAVILTCLLFFPKLGVLLFWNILIPVAPLLFVVALGVWRNVCPLGITTLIPRRWGLSKRKKLNATQMGVLNFIAVIALYIIVPLRHAVFNRNGVATGIMIIVMAAIGVGLGLVYEWKSAWCSGLCPVHPVEKLYGANVITSIPNAHCDRCQNCVIPCPDSTPNMTPRSASKTIWHRISGWMVVAGLPGFIYGWFRVPDSAGLGSMGSMIEVYRAPLIGFIVSSALYFFLTSVFGRKSQPFINSVFAASGVSIYYIFRIPALLGFGINHKDGLLIDLHGVVASWLPFGLTMVSTAFFFYWLVIRKPNKESWVVRPAYANKQAV
jgi:hypothetical protein